MQKRIKQQNIKEYVKSRPKAELEITLLLELLLRFRDQEGLLWT
jgi:hypothetical protein